MFCNTSAYTPYLSPFENTNTPDCTSGVSSFCFFAINSSTQRCYNHHWKSPVKLMHIAKWSLATLINKKNVERFWVEIFRFKRRNRRLNCKKTENNKGKMIIITISKALCFFQSLNAFFQHRPIIFNLAKYKVRKMR